LSQARCSAENGAVAGNSAIKRVYLIDQDYVWGRSVAADAREMLSAKRPDIQIVGDDLHPARKIARRPDLSMTGGFTRRSAASC
jgi:branched-chain amino acid transport system substrate-binding protein